MASNQAPHSPCTLNLHPYKQTELSAPAYTIQHDPAIWGDPAVFRPERWLEEQEAGKQPEKDNNNDKWPPKGADLKKYLLTFGMGPRACIGKKSVLLSFHKRGTLPTLVFRSSLATMQMQLILATLVLRYEMEARDDVLESVEGFMHKPVAVWAHLRRRSRRGVRGE